MATRCHTTDLDPAMCACPTHHNPDTGSSRVLHIRQLESATGRRMPEYRPQPRPSRWQVPDPQATTCDHRDDDLCGDCARLLEGLLSDLPGLVAEVGAAVRKDTRFAPRGHRRGVDVDRPDESPIPWNPAAAAALAGLHQVMVDGPTLGRHGLLAGLSRAAGRAHRVIDRPPDRLFTACPRCRADIEVPDRARGVQCPAAGCGYAASWEGHQQDLLDAHGDVWLTAGQLVGVLCRNGEPITRQRISYLADRHGLPRERLVRPSWKAGGGIVATSPVFVYRLRDVRDLQAELGKDAS